MKARARACAILLLFLEWMSATFRCAGMQRHECAACFAMIFYKNKLQYYIADSTPLENAGTVAGAYRCKGRRSECCAGSYTISSATRKAFPLLVAIAPSLSTAFADCVHLLQISDGEEGRKTSEHLWSVLFSLCLAREDVEVCWLIQLLDSVDNVEASRSDLFYATS